MAWISFARRKVVSILQSSKKVIFVQTNIFFDKELYKNGSFVIKYLLLISLGRHYFVVASGWLTGEAGGMRV